VRADVAQRHRRKCIPFVDGHWSVALLGAISQGIPALLT
jgi:hypothetical protein